MDYPIKSEFTDEMTTKASNSDLTTYNDEQDVKIKLEPTIMDEVYVKTEDWAVRNDGTKTTKSDPDSNLTNKDSLLCTTFNDEEDGKIKLEPLKTEEIDIKTEKSVVVGDLEMSTEMEQEHPYVDYIKERPFKCETCNYRFSQKSTLKTHLKTHTGERPFRCETCSCYFSVKGNLFRHMKTHTGEKPFKCVECDSQFSLKNTLTKHMRIHTGEKPFECETCSCQFSQMSTLKDHMKTHTGEKPFKCGKCNCQFSWKSNLYRHMKSHTGEKAFKCKICNCQFS